MAMEESGDGTRRRLPLECEVHPTSPRVQWAWTVEKCNTNNVAINNVSTTPRKNVTFLTSHGVPSFLLEVRDQQALRQAAATSQAAAMVTPPLLRLLYALAVLQSLLTRNMRMEILLVPRIGRVEGEVWRRIQRSESIVVSGRWCGDLI